MKMAIELSQNLFYFFKFNYQVKVINIYTHLRFFSLVYDFVYHQNQSTPT